MNSRQPPPRQLYGVAVTCNKSVLATTTTDADDDDDIDHKPMNIARIMIKPDLKDTGCEYLKASPAVSPVNSPTH